MNLRRRLIADNIVGKTQTTTYHDRHQVASAKMITRIQSYTYVCIDRVDPCIPCTKQGRQVRCLVELFNQLDMSLPQPLLSPTRHFLNPSFPQSLPASTLPSSTPPFLNRSLAQTILSSIPHVELAQVQLATSIASRLVTDQRTYQSHERPRLRP